MFPAAANPHAITGDTHELSPDPPLNPHLDHDLAQRAGFCAGFYGCTTNGNWEICVNDGGTSSITVNFKDESYQTVILINGHHVVLAPPANNGWALVFTRQDYISGKPSAPSNESSFVLDPHERYRFELPGHYYSQSRNLRLSVSY